MLIKLTEIKKVQGKLEEGPILINPEGIAAVLEDTDQLVKGDIHIFGSDNNEHRILSLIQMRTGQKLAVKETLDEIQALANAHGDTAQNLIKALNAPRGMAQGVNQGASF